MANKFRAIALNTLDVDRTLVYHPKIRTDKPTAEKDLLELKTKYPDRKTFMVIQPGDPLWKDD
ncbi:hypothetical protein [Lysobacter terrae]